MVSSLVLLQLLIVMLMGVHGQVDLPGEDCVPTGGTASDGQCNTDNDCCDLVSECNGDSMCSLPPPVCTDETCGEFETCIAGASCVPLVAELNMTGFGDPDSPYLGTLSYDGEDVYLIGEEDDSSGNINVTKAIVFDPEANDNVHILFDGLGRPERMFLEKDETTVFKLVFDDNDFLVGMVEDGDAGGSDRRLSNSITTEDVDLWQTNNPWGMLHSEEDRDPVCQVSWSIKYVRFCSVNAPNCLGIVCRVIIIRIIVESKTKEECCIGSYCLEDCDD